MTQFIAMWPVASGLYMPNSAHYVVAMVCLAVHLCILTTFLGGNVWFKQYLFMKQFNSNTIFKRYVQDLTVS